MNQATEIAANHPSPASNVGCACGKPVDLAVVDEVVKRRGTKPDAAIGILHELHDAFKYLPREALERVCQLTDITPAQITGVSTFFPSFRHQPAGQHLVQVCHGTACHVAGAEHITDALSRHLNLAGGRDSSADGLFTVERVACLGCCTLAPVMVIDGIAYGHLDPAGSVDCLDRFLKDEAAGLHDREREQRQLGAPRGNGGGKPAVELRIGLNSCCIASGSLEVSDALERAVRESGCDAVVKSVGCTGMCHRVPLIEMVTADGRSTLFGDNDAAQATQVVKRKLKPGGLWRRAQNYIERAFEYFGGDEAWRRAQASTIDPEEGPGGAFLAPQVRIVTERAGAIDPLDIDDYLAADGYQALRRCVTELTPGEAIDVVRRSGLRGRGGAGFPTAAKWELSRNASGEPKYVICNGDEGDPGAFMDRMLLEAYPHRVLEGLAIAAWAVGAREGLLYIRAEYQLAVQRVEKAIAQAEARGFLGEGIFGTETYLKLRVVCGAGAFVCGEETALIASVEGRRGMPRFRPPYPAERGLYGRPTNVNNVETYACVPWILRRGAEAFAALGTAASKGTKVFALAGRVRRGGLIEVPMGTTIREIVERIGGGAREGREFKAVQLGGPSGGCIPAWLGHTPVDYEAVRETGAIMGSGGLIVMDDETCMVDVARFFLDFTQKESCGQCTFCRIGTKRMLEILERLCAGEGKARDLDELEELGRQIVRTSLCGLGKTAPNPVLSTLKYFRDEYEAHVAGRCPAGKCEKLIRFTIGEKCIGCTLCAQDCPTKAIAPLPYQQHEIDEAKCVRCGACKKVCPESAVTIEPLRAID